ncbi:MAG: DUF3048 domain-containing protein [Pseudonocardiaceae bacterium]
MGRRGCGNQSGALTVLLVVLFPVLVLSCGDSSALVPVQQGAPATAPAPPTPPDPPAPPPVSSFTGLATDVNAPVLCVKIDNASVARPQSGLAQADVVYVEPVEGGLSRLLAVYQSQLPPVVGPVRSVRQSDLRLLAGFGRPALAFSGEAAALRPLIEQAPVLDVSAPVRPGAYHRDFTRFVPHNLFADPHQLREGGAPARDIGFRFGPPPPGGRPTPSTDVSYQATQIGVQWIPEEARWVVAMDGAPLTTAAGERPGAATVVLQRVAVHETDIRDAAGTPSPFAETVGDGEAVVLRDGQAFTGRWSRPTPAAGTTFTLPDGAPLTFAPGPVWVVLLPA